MNEKAIKQMLASLTEMQCKLNNIILYFDDSDEGKEVLVRTNLFIARVNIDSAINELQKSLNKKYLINEN